MGNRGAFGSISSKKKRQVLRSDKDVENWMIREKHELKVGGDSKEKGQ